MSDFRDLFIRYKILMCGYVSCYTDMRLVRMAGRQYEYYWQM